MHKLPILTVVLSGACVSLPHMTPGPRFDEEQRKSVVTVESSCSESGDLEDSLIGAWGYDHTATGVLISERHAVTALHVVDCPNLPNVHVVLPDGRRLRMVVEEEDRSNDSARLVIFSADRFRLGVVPPAIADDLPYRAMLCADTLRNESCGPRTGLDLFDAPTHPGDSGSPVYEAWTGRLVGIVSAGNGIVTRYSPASPSWLKGT